MEVYQRAYNDKDWAACLRVLQDIAKLEGLYVDEVKGDLTFTIEVDMPEEDKEFNNASKSESKELTEHN